MATPTVMDSFELTEHKIVNNTSDSFSYTVPSGGANKVFVVIGGMNNGSAGIITAISLNSVDFTASVTEITGVIDRAYYWYAILPAPTSGTFSITTGANIYYDYVVFTIQDAAQTGTVDVSNVTNNIATSVTTSVTTTVGNDLLIACGFRTNSVFTTYGASETEMCNLSDATGLGYCAWTNKPAGATAGSESMTMGGSGARDTDVAVMALKSSEVPVTAKPKSIESDFIIYN